MSKLLSLFFAVTGVMLFICIGISLSYRLPWLALIFAIAAVLYTGFGFIVKARLRKKG